ncbi:protease pro-enzyme activation domain-containing protein [Kutzneria sp. NPDC052558]|uniref:protease pro-enzyme activation domain-containing protein n=1 Tax=Kutzneria sp. NPDC052558 TaxID=3364121 RepID=UPI0037C9F8CA
MASAQTTQAGLVPQAVGQAPAVPHGAVAAAAPAADAKLNLSVALAPRDQAALDAFVQRVSDPKSPQYKQYLGKGQFGGVFGATQKTIDAVTKSLRDAGLTPGTPTPDGLSIPVTATVAQAKSALGVDIAGYKMPDGRLTYANTSAPKLPASVAPSVTGVLGLNNLVKPTPSNTSTAKRFGASATAAAKPNLNTPGVCPQIRDLASSNGFRDTFEYWEPYSLAQSYAYNIDPLFGQYGDNGNGVTVGIFELEDFSYGDIVEFQNCMNAHANVNKIPVAGGPHTAPDPNGGVGTESALDIEYVNGIAPGATVNVYQGPDANVASDNDVLQTYQRMVTDDTAQVISTSWGLCEADLTTSYMTAEKNIFAQAAAQGQTVVASSGDQGSSGCYYGQGAPNSSLLNVSDPANQQYVTAVGGTSKFGPNTTESVWNTPAGGGRPGIATGGGVSTFTVLSGAANYQAGRTGPGYSSTVCNAPAGAACRQVPDVAAIGDPNTGYLIANGTFTNGGQTVPTWTIIGGTSGSAPLWAGIFALANSSHPCAATGPVGFANPALYAAPSSTYFDVIQGSNYVSDSGNTKVLYSAGSGYDLTTGLGTPHAPQVVEAVCNAKPAPAGAKYTPVAPSRLLDTRSTGQTLGGGSTLPLQVAGQGGVPATGATAVVLNVTATNTTGNSFLTVFPDGQPRPISSNLNYTPGVTVPNLVTVQLPANGKIDFYNNAGNADVVADVFGYYSADGASGYKQAGPARLLDTRSSGPSLGDHGTRLLQVTGQQGIPATDVTAVILNVTATNPTGNSFISVYPGGTPVPASSNLNFGPGQTIANLVTVPVGSDGTVSFFNHVGTVDVVADVFGYYTTNGTGLSFHATAPARLADSRTGAGLIGNNGSPIGSGGVAQLAIQNVNGQAGNNGLLGTAGALALNVTATNPTANSYLTVYGSSTPLPSSSNLNFTPGLTIPNSVVVPTNGGAINLFNHVGNVDVVVDLFGYFS